MLDFPTIFLFITALANVGLAFYVYWRNPRDAVNTSFTLLVLFLTFWALSIIQFRLVDVSGTALYFMKLSYVSAIMLAASFYYFSIVFPENIRPTVWHRNVTITLAAVMSCLLLLPQFLTKGIIYYSGGKGVLLGTTDYILFATVFILFFVGGHVRLWWKFFHSRASEPKHFQLLFVAAGGTVSGVIGMYYNLFLPSPFLEDFRYIWTGPVFTFFYAVIIIYSIFRYRLFNVKAILAELLVFSLWLFILMRTLLAADTSSQFLDVGLLGITVVIGTLLIRSVDREVAQRELIEEQEHELEDVNHRQENLIHFISHEVKGYLAKSEAAFAAIDEGDYGPVSPELKKMDEMALGETRKGVDTVMDILSAGDLKKGTLALSMKPFDMSAAATRAVEAARATAVAKGLELSYTLESSTACVVNGDEAWIEKHVIKNLLDNAIIYTQSGSVRVSLSCANGAVRLSVADTGMGIEDEDKARLFTEGGRGKDSMKINAHSTGYGLFIAKEIVDAHHGTISAESEGKGKGSTFTVELPTV